MSAPNKVTNNGTLVLGLGTAAGIVDETHIVASVPTTVFTVEEFSYDPTTKEIETMDSDEAIIMTKDVSPQAMISMKGQTKNWSGMIAQIPGTALTTTISGGAVALANLTQSINGFDYTAGTLKLRTIKHTQARLMTASKTDLTIRHLPHVVNA